MAHRIRIEIDGRSCIGIDVGDRWCQYHREDAEGTLLDRGKVRTTQGDMAEVFGSMEPSRIALEVGSHSPWLSELLAVMGHEVTVANAYQVSLISRSKRKDDKTDAKLLCWLLRADPKLLFPIKHRGLKARADLVKIRTRDAHVRSRTLLINYVRGIVKSFGARIPSGVTAGCFHRRAREYIPAELRGALYPTLELLAHHTSRIDKMNKEIQRLCQTQYPETKYLEQVSGVGPITALTYVLTIEDPGRFSSEPRDVAAYLGLVPRRRASGSVDPELSITKAGDGVLRRLLVQCAHHILGRRGGDSDLKRWGRDLAGRGRKGAKKRAVIAVARKLSVILLSLWSNETKYDPHRKAVQAA